MSDPIVSASDLGVYLNDSTINVPRAEMMIRYAQNECEVVLSPLPAAAAGIVMRIAARGYVSTTQARSPQLAAAGSPFGSAPGGASGVYRTSKDEYDLTRLAESGAGGVAAFTIRVDPDRPRRSPDADGGWSQAGWSNGWGNYGSTGPVW